MFGDWTLRRRLMGMMMVSSCATLFVVTVAWLAYDRASTREAMLFELSTMGEIVGSAAGSAIDPGRAKDIEESLLVTPTFVDAKKNLADIAMGAAPQSTAPPQLLGIQE